MILSPSERATLARVLGTRRVVMSGMIQPLASDWSTNNAARADTLSLPSRQAKLIEETGDECTPICLESLEGQAPNSYLGTDATGAVGMWPLPTSSGGDSAIAAPPGTAEPNNLITGTIKGQIYAQTDPSGSYVLRQWVFNGIPLTNLGWI